MQQGVAGSLGSHLCCTADSPSWVMLVLAEGAKGVPCNTRTQQQLLLPVQCIVQDQ